MNSEVDYMKIIDEKSVSSSYSERCYARVLERSLQGNDTKRTNLDMIKIGLRTGRLPKIIREAYLKAIQIEETKADVVESYRWLIEFIINFKSYDASYFEIVKTCQLNPKGVHGEIINKFSELGIDIKPGEKYGYVVCEYEPETNVRFVERVYETGYFLRSQKTDKPLKIDYHYYVRKLDRINGVLLSLGPLPDDLIQICYRRSIGAKEIYLREKPVELIAAMIQKGEDLNKLLAMLE